MFGRNWFQLAVRLDWREILKGFKAVEEGPDCQINPSPLELVHKAMGETTLGFHRTISGEDVPSTH